MLVTFSKCVFNNTLSCPTLLKTMKRGNIKAASFMAVIVYVIKLELPQCSKSTTRARQGSLPPAHVMLTACCLATV